MMRPFLKGLLSGAVLAVPILFIWFKLTIGRLPVSDDPPFLREDLAPSASFIHLRMPVPGDALINPPTLALERVSPVREIAANDIERICHEGFPMRFRLVRYHEAEIYLKPPVRQALLDALDGHSGDVWQTRVGQRVFSRGAVADFERLGFQRLLEEGDPRRYDIGVSLSDFDWPDFETLGWQITGAAALPRCGGVS